jgi:hypothetical protein
MYNQEHSDVLSVLRELLPLQVAGNIISYIRNTSYGEVDMKTTARIIIGLIVLLLLGSMNASSAEARRGGHGGHGPRVGVGFWIGPGWGWPYYYPSYYYPYYPPEQTIVIQQQPEGFAQPLPQEEQPLYWYYCKDPQGYYPYVKKCPNGWMKVVPTPPDTTTEPPE